MTEQTAITTTESTAISPLGHLTAAIRPAAVCPVQGYLDSLSAGSSRKSMRYTLSRIAELMEYKSAESMPWHLVGAVEMDRMRTMFAERFAPATANRMIAACKGVLKAAWRSGQIDTDTYMRAIDVQPVRGKRLPAGRCLSQGEARALFGVCAQDRSAAGPRDAAAFALMYGAGLRRQEVADLQLQDYDPDSGAIRLVGKGNKERIVYAVNGGQAAIEAWLRHRGGEPGPLLHPVNKAGDVLTGCGMSAQALMLRLKSRSRAAGIAECSPHDLRRSFVSELLDAGADISAVQSLAGHSSVDTTARYDRRGERAARRAADMIHVPFAVQESE